MMKEEGVTETTISQAKEDGNRNIRQGTNY